MIRKIIRERFTFNIMKVNFKTKEVYSVYLQFSLKDPWLFPKYEPHFGTADIPLYGWLFFYFGRYTDGILYETSDEDAEITDRKNHKYHIFTAKDRTMRDEMRKAVKNKATFDVKESINTNGRKHSYLIVHK